MYKKNFWGFAFLTILVGLCVWLLAKVPVQLGIDLQGGTELTYALDLSLIESNRQGIAEEVKDVISKRLNAYGLKEISIAVQGEDQLVIQLPGTDLQTVSELKNQIERAGNLTFRLVGDDQNPDLMAQYEREWQQYLDLERAWVEKKLANPNLTERRPQPPRYLVLSQVEKVKEGNRERFQPKPNGKLILENFHPTYDEKTQTWIPEGSVSGSYLDSVNPTIDQNTFRPAIGFRFTGEGATEFSELTRINKGRSLAIVLDDDIMQVATIREQITGAGQLSGDFSDEDVKGIITILRGGSLKTRPSLVSESTVGSVLGQDSIRSGMTAVLWGLAGVMLIMAVYYMWGGLVADVALMLNLIFIMSFVVCFRQTLTLPGIAGILLTLAMAVDANILIFERYREERKKGKPFGPSLSAAYNRAFWVIFDSNLTTLITAYVLFYLGTGPVKGFAVTLITGIIASFFTSVFVTRLILSVLGRMGVIKDIPMLEAFKTPRIPFTRYQRPFVMASAILIALTWSIVIWRGKANYGIDFTGGARITMNLAKPVEIEELRRKVSDLASSRPELFRDYSVQTIGGDGKVSRTFAILTRAGSGPVANAEEKTAEPAAPSLPAPAGTTPGDSPGATPAATPPAQDPGGAAGTAAPAPASAPPAPAQPSTSPAGAEITSEDGKPRPPDPAQLVRQELEGMLRAEGWLVPPAFPSTTWESPVGAPPGTVSLVMEVNLLDDTETFTPEDLKRRLNSALDAIPLLSTKGRADSAAYKGLSVDTVDVVERPSEASPVTRYRIRTTAFQPAISATGSEAGAVPTRTRAEDGIRRFFADQTRAGALKMSEPFSEVTTVGPKVASSLQADALVAVFISIVGIVFYMSLRFEFIYGLAGIIALIHDVMVAVGIMAVTDMLFPTTFPVKLNLNELAAILTIIGFSINDTIVLFDRIRENKELLAKRRITLEDNINISINQTLSRTLWTSTTVLLVVVTLIAFGGESIRGFAYVFAVGTVAGVYSSVFIAAPVALWLFRRAEARRAQIAAMEAGFETGRGDRRR